MDRLTAVTPSKTLQQKGLPIEAYSYDAIDNRIGSVHQSGDWLYNDKNQLIQWGEGNKQTKLTYMANGHLTKETTNGKELTYTYNSADRLVNVKEGDKQIAAYQYDPFGRRISKTVNNVTTYFIYTDEGLLAELDEKGNLLVAYGWQPDTPWGTSPLWQANLTTNQTLQTANYHYLITDYLGTPQLAINSKGQQIWKVLSDAFGNTVIDTNNQTTNRKYLIVLVLLSFRLLLYLYMGRWVMVIIVIVIVEVPIILLQQQQVGLALLLLIITKMVKKKIQSKVIKII